MKTNFKILIMLSISFICSYIGASEDKYSKTPKSLHFESYAIKIETNHDYLKYTYSLLPENFYMTIYTDEDGKEYIQYNEIKNNFISSIKDKYGIEAQKDDIKDIAFTVLSSYNDEDNHTIEKTESNDYFKLNLTNRVLQSICNNKNNDRIIIHLTLTENLATNIKQKYDKQKAEREDANRTKIKSKYQYNFANLIKNTCILTALGLGCYLKRDAISSYWQSAKTYFFGSN